jgi:homoserine dehydrogenase
MNQPLKLGIAGLGTVGSGVLQLLGEQGERLCAAGGRRIEIAGVCARTRSKRRAAAVGRLPWFDSAERLAADASIDVFVELIGGEDGAAKAAVETALRQGKAVVTANKALLARHGAALAAIAEASGAALNFEAAVAGGIPRSAASTASSTALATTS